MTGSSVNPPSSSIDTSKEDQNTDDVAAAENNALQQQAKMTSMNAIFTSTSDGLSSIQSAMKTSSDGSKLT